MVTSGAGRGIWAAATSTVAAIINGMRRIIEASVYRTRGIQPFRTRDDRAFAPQFESSIVASPSHGPGRFRRHRHGLPLLPQDLAVGREILARRVLGVPLRCVEQHDAAGLFVFEQRE